MSAPVTPPGIGCPIVAAALIVLVGGSLYLAVHLVAALVMAVWP